MRLRRFAQTCALGSALTLTVALAAPAMAEEALDMAEPGAMPAGPDTRPVWTATPPLPSAPAASMPMHGAAPSYPQPAVAGPDPQARAAWLDECRRRMTRRDDGVGGAVVGGLLGGLFGNRVAGRHHRTTGTIIGGVAGAVAGAVIDRAEDSGRTRGKDYCEAYLDDYYARYQAGYGYQGQAYGYAVPVMMVPVAMQPMQHHAAPRTNCTEEVVEEYVDVPVASRRIYRAPARRVVPSKRVRVVPDKRIPIN